MIDNKFAFIRPVRGPVEVGQMIELAKNDNHAVFMPTDTIEKDGKIAGYFSVAGMPLVLAWLSTTQLTSRDSFHLINTVENLITRTGGKGVVFPVPKDSPFYGLMETMGFRNVGSYDLFVKEY